MGCSFVNGTRLMLLRQSDELDDSPTVSSSRLPAVHALWSARSLPERGRRLHA